MEKISKFTIPMHLPARDAVLMAKEARENGTLQCLVSPGVCEYYCEETETQCAIGVSFTPEVAQALENYVLEHYGYFGIDDILEKGYVTTDNADALIRLQRAHDGVLGQYDWNTCDENGKYKFLGLIESTVRDFDRTVETLLAELPETQ